MAIRRSRPRAKATLRLIDGNGSVSVSLKPAASNEFAVKDARIKPGKGRRWC
jgi:hypothetical protein